MLQNASIENFGKNLIKHVRDEAIRSLDRNIENESWMPSSERWHGSGFDIRTMIPDIVDETLFYLLNRIDQEMIPLEFILEDGKSVDLAEDGMGELGGWFMGIPDGWRDGFSAERYHNDFTD